MKINPARNEVPRWIYFKIIHYLVAGGIAVESIFTVSTFAGDTDLVLSAGGKSELVFCIDDSLVPQLTTKIPNPMASNKNFFILFYFWCRL